MEITPREFADPLARGEAVRLLDIRTREEWDAVRLDGAEFVNQELVQSLMGSAPRDALLVFYDHSGTASLDAAAYFAGHGFTGAKFLRGGIDAWAQEVDAKMPRYKLENG
jgi:rhodanese-related sulfurtransferase